MAEIQTAVASAVILPESVEHPSSPQGGAKRRQSSFSDTSSKRPRIGQRESPDRKSPPAIEDKSSSRRKSGQLEERKRGQRLFGALLGTLSQSSSSVAQKRRTDIEKKQQAKLKLQAEEYDEKKKQQLEALMVIRRGEQKKYNKQSMQIRHSNLLAAAQFLQTETEPKLYYKPWELLPGDEAKIKAQVGAAEAVIDRETLEFETQHTEAHEHPIQVETESREHHEEPEAKTPETVGPTANQAQPDGSLQMIDTNHDPANMPDAANSPPTPNRPTQESSKDHTDDNGEVVLEAEEDTVIY